MARCLNTNCDFDAGFLISDIPRDTIQVVLKIRTKWGKHTLTEDHKKWTEKYRLWEKHAKCITLIQQKGLNPFHYIKYMIWGLLKTQEHGYKLLEILSLHARSSMTQALIKRILQ